MDRGRWERIQEIFHEAVERSGEERRAYLVAACGGDRELLAEVTGMVTADDEERAGQATGHGSGQGGSSGSVLDRGLPEIVLDLMGGDERTPPAEEIGPYRLIRLLGEGGMGVVWLAERSDLGNLVAIKFLPNAGLSPSRRERFTVETLTLARFKHPYIARLYDAGTLENGAPWFAMEYVKGLPFTEYCAENPLSVEEQLGLFRKVCEAVQYAHGQATLHRDLKPSNILVEEDGTPKLLDFGIARQLQELNDGGGQTRPGLRFMCPPYAAPEWIREGVLGLPTDVYSLGVMLYEMLTGRLPRREDMGPSNVVGDLPGPGLEHEPEKPSLLAKGDDPASGRRAFKALSKVAWRDLDVLCLTAMHADPGKRYRSVEALIRDLDHYLKGEPLEARPDALSYKISKFVKRNRRAVLAACLGVLLVVGLTVAFAVRLARARDAALAEAARAQRIQHFMVTMLGGSEKEAAPATDLRVVTLLDRSAKEADSLSADPEAQGELYEDLGNMYDKLGAYPRADQLLSLALDRRMKALAPDDPKIAEALERVAAVKADESDYKDAELYAQRGLDMLARHLPGEDPRVIDAKSTLGRVVAEAEDFKRAIAIVEPLVQRRTSSPEEEYTLSQNLTTLTVAEYSLGDEEKSDALAHRALDLDRRLFGDAHPQVADDYLNLGLNKDALSMNRDAEAYFRKAAEILLAWYGPDHPDLAEARVLLSRTLVAEGKDAEAESILVAVLPVQERALGPVNERVAVTLDTLGNIAMRRNTLDEAEADLTRAVEIYRKLHGEKNADTALLTADLGQVYLREKKYARADEVMGPAVKTLLETIPNDSISMAMARATWGHALTALKRYGEAEPELAAAYGIFKGQPKPDLEEMKSLVPDTMRVYGALHEAEKEKKLRDEVSSLRAPVASK